MLQYRSLVARLRAGYLDLELDLEELHFMIEFANYALIM